MTRRKPVPPVMTIVELGSGWPSAARSVPSTTPVVNCARNDDWRRTAIVSRSPSRTIKALLTGFSIARRVPIVVGSCCMSHVGFDLSAAARQEMVSEGFDPDFPPEVGPELAALAARPGPAPDG